MRAADAPDVDDGPKSSRNLIGSTPGTEARASRRKLPQATEGTARCQARSGYSLTGNPTGCHDEVFHDDEYVVRTLAKILDDASESHRKLDPAEGLQDAQLDTGARMHIVHGDVGRDGHLLVNIRRFTGVKSTFSF